MAHADDRLDDAGAAQGLGTADGSAADKVLGAVRDLLPVLRDRAAETENLRRLPDDTIRDLQETGVLRLLQPRHFGGHEAHPVVFYRAVRLLASACGSTGWVASVLGVHPWHIGLFAEAAQREVWSEDLDTRASSSYAPQGRATKVEGGYTFTGRWSFSSGSDHCTWVLLGGLVLGDDGIPTDFCSFLVPRTDYQVVDVWDTVGLRGTGSNDIVVEDAFVPDHRVLSFGSTSRCRCPGQDLNDGPLFRMPYGSVHPFAITAPLLGMADGAYEAYVGHTRKRVRAAYLGEKAKDDPFAQVRIAQAAADIDAGWLALERDIGEEYESATSHTRITIDTRLRARRDQVVGSARAIKATDALFESAGGRAINASAPIARFWRDAHAARVHAANDVERSLVLYGRSELGLPIPDGLY